MGCSRNRRTTRTPWKELRWDAQGWSPVSLSTSDLHLVTNLHLVTERPVSWSRVATGPVRALGCLPWLPPVGFSQTYSRSPPTGKLESRLVDTMVYQNQYTPKTQAFLARVCWGITPKYGFER